ncbi:MAG: hypothetical protein HGA27_00360 [Peptococcaceae bacterium]|nr:hypothetical protein [Peptococcaceae bacterium]
MGKKANFLLLVITMAGLVSLSFGIEDVIKSNRPVPPIEKIIMELKARSELQQMEIEDLREQQQALWQISVDISKRAGVVD